MKIKALSLWQPWASLIAVGAKKYETRSWRTSYHGPILICASQRHPTIKEAVELYRHFNCEKVYEVIVKQLYPDAEDPYFPIMRLYEQIPFGEAVAIAYHSVCIPTATMRWPWSWTDEMKQREIAFGDFSDGRYAWKLENVRPIVPFPVKGKQGLFEVELPENIIRELSI